MEHISAGSGPSVEALLAQPRLVSYPVQVGGFALWVRPLRDNDAPTLESFYESLEAQARYGSPAEHGTWVRAASMAGSLGGREALRLVVIEAGVTSRTEGRHQFPTGDIVGLIQLELDFASPSGREDLRRYAARGIELTDGRAGRFTTALVHRWAERGLARALVSPVLDVAGHLGCSLLMTGGGVAVVGPWSEALITAGFEEAGRFTNPVSGEVTADMFCVLRGVAQTA